MYVCKQLNMIWYNFICMQGVLGIKVRIMLEWDAKGMQGPKKPLPDVVTIHPPKEEEEEQQQSIVPRVAGPIDTEVAAQVA